MKTPTKVITALIALIGLMAWYGSTLYKKAHERMPPSPIPDELKKETETRAIKIADAVKADGIQKTVWKLVKEIDHSAVDKIKADLMDTVALLNIERSKVKQVMVVATSLSIENQILKKQVNQLATTYVHTDDHFRLAVNVPKDSLKAATFNVGYDADLVTAQYNKGNWFTGNRNYMDIYSNDPRFTIKGARTLTVKQKQPFFTADLHAISEYNINTRAFNSGPALSIGLGRIEVRGKYLYDPFERNWTGIVSGGYMLLRK